MRIRCPQNVCRVSTWCVQGVCRVCTGFVRCAYKVYAVCVQIVCSVCTDCVQCVCVSGSELVCSSVCLTQFSMISHTYPP